MKKQAGKLVQSERGFTLLEVVVAVMIIGVVGTIVLQTVIKANTSMEISNVQTFMDNLTQSAREVYKSDPETVLFKDFTASLNDFYPFSGMARKTTATTDKDTNTGVTKYNKVFTQFYSSSLATLNTEDHTPAMYKVEFTFVPMDKESTISAPGFQYKAAEYKMVSKLYVKNKADASWNEEPLYDKTYSFDNISVKNLDSNTGKKYATVKLEPVDGTIVLADGSTIEPTGTSTEFDIFIGDSIGSMLTQTAKKSGDYIFKGWSKDKNSPATSAEIIRSSEPVTGDTILYAKYLSPNEFAVTYEIDANQNFNVSNLNPTVKEVDMGIKTMGQFPSLGEAKTADGKIGGDKMFANNVVSQPGKIFDGWQDATGKKYNVSDSINPKYTILKPIMVDTKEESIDLNLELDISGTNVTARNEKNNITTRHILYPYSDVSYELYINNGKPRVIGKVYQKKSVQPLVQEIAGIDAVHPSEKGIAEVVYDSDKDNGTIVFKDRNGTSYNTFEEYYKKSPEIAEIKSKNVNQIRINNTKLSVKYMGIDMKSFTKNTNEKDTITSRLNGRLVDDATLDKIFVQGESPTGNGTYTKESQNKISETILNLDKSIKSVNINNVVNVDLKNSQLIPAFNYTISTNIGAKKARIVNLNLTLPTGYINSGSRPKSLIIQSVEVRIGKRNDGKDWIETRIRGHYNNENTIILGQTNTENIIGMDRDGWMKVIPAYDSDGNRYVVDRIKLRGDLAPDNIHVYWLGNKQSTIYNTDVGATGWFNDGRIMLHMENNAVNIYNSLNHPSNYRYPQVYTWEQIASLNPGTSFKFANMSHKNIEAGWASDNILSGGGLSTVTYVDEYSLGGGTSRSIVSFAPQDGDNAVLPYWLKSVRKTK